MFDVAKPRNKFEHLFPEKKWLTFEVKKISIYSCQWLASKQHSTQRFIYIYIYIDDDDYKEIIPNQKNDQYIKLQGTKKKKKNYLQNPQSKSVAHSVCSMLILLPFQV